MQAHLNHQSKPKRIRRSKARDQQQPKPIYNSPAKANQTPKSAKLIQARHTHTHTHTPTHHRPTQISLKPKLAQTNTAENQPNPCRITHAPTHTHTLTNTSARERAPTHPCIRTQYMKMLVAAQDPYTPIVLRAQLTHHLLKAPEPKTQ